MQKCKFCDFLINPKYHLLKTWKLGKGKRKTVIGQFKCPNCGKTFNKSLGSVVEGEDEKDTENKENL